MSRTDDLHGVRHIAISADGNGEWATRRNLPPSAGNEKSQDAFLAVLATCLEINLPYLSLHVFSSENWGESTDEVRDLVSAFTEVLEKRCETFLDLGIRFVWAGKEADLPPELLNAIARVEAATADNSRLCLQLCLNYGGHAEILHAAKGMARASEAGQLELSTATESDFRRYLYSPDIPDVDLYIRTAGELRLSNFMLWQCAYAELVFTDELWPDFRKEHLLSAIQSYAARRATFGGLT
ncbi:MAG TPA: polyprenyl diphosphate synthase [Jatrophihabitans sp.]|jgi:undecaprenyl diphosphate synthase|uniref:polyprenyl diphosphate synthase n=1 Tax=Jatrophihabitans sp. TaxID=1932789 RepID=UPI002EDC20BF